MGISTRHWLGLAMAVLPLGALASATTAGDAAPLLRISGEGSGQVLLFPYYTVQGNGPDRLSTVLTLRNQGDAPTAARLRLRESHNGRTTLSLNLYLRPREILAASIMGWGDGAALFVAGDGCAIDESLRPAREFPLTSSDYTGLRRDHPVDAPPALSSIERAFSGFIEVIEMGTLDAGAAVSEVGDEMHSRQPDGCGAVRAAWAGPWRTEPSRSIGLPAGRLNGSVSVIDVDGGIAFAAPATALRDFYALASDPGGLHAAAASPQPDLASADHGGFVSVRVAESDGTARVPRQEGRPDAVSLALMTAALENSVSLSAFLGASASFVVTFPTRHYYDDGLSTLFPDRFDDNGRACSAYVPLSVRANGQGVGAGRADLDRDREICSFISPFVPSPLPRVCGSAATLVPTLVADARRGPLRDPNAHVITPAYADDDGLFTFGTGFVTDQPTTCFHKRVPPAYLEIAGTRWEGLPAIGFVANTFVNDGVSPGVRASYGISAPHQRARAGSR